MLGQIEHLLPASCVVTALVLCNDMKTLCVIRLEKDIEPVLHKLKYEQKYTEEFKQIITENDRSMKQSERLKFWTSRNLLNQKLATFTEDLDRKVLGYARGLLLGTFTTLDIGQLCDKFTKDLGLGVLTNEQRNLVRILLIGLEYSESKEVREALETEFRSDVEKIHAWIMERKVKLSDLPRKHVCLLVDKVWNKLMNFFNSSVERRNNGTSYAMIFELLLLN